MKTAISIPDATFAAAEHVAARLGMSRSELYSRAVHAFVDAHREDGVTQGLDRVHASVPVELDPLLQTLQAASLPREDW